MEFVSGIKLRTIFLDNGNWWKLFIKHRNLIRISIIINVLKLLVCRTSFLGYHYYVCDCGKSIKVPHSCKSRFCSSCGKMATDNWMKTSLNKLPKTTWQHITFTMPSELGDFFWLNRHLMNKIPLIAASIAHIPDKNFRNIRYYGFLSNRLTQELLPIVYNLLSMKSFFINKVYEPWRNKIKSVFKYDPLKCPLCKSIMKLNTIIFPHTTPLLSMHKEIALGYFNTI